MQFTEKKKSRVPDVTKFAVVLTSLPRWALAMMAADGLTVPKEWTAVHVLSGLFGAAMSVAEGVALAYILGVFANTGKDARKMLGRYILLTTVVFVVTLAPSVYARAANDTVANVMTPLAIWVWAAAVILSTIVTAQAVGYAQSLETDLEKEVENIQSRFVLESDKLRDEIAGRDEQIARFQEQLEQVQSVKQLPEAVKPTKREQHYDTILAELKKNPDATIQSLANTIGMSKPTVYNILADLEKQGRLHRNGHTEVLETEKAA